MNLNEELELEIQKSIYRESYYEFFKDAFAVLNPTDVYSDNWHIEYLCGRLQQEVERIKAKKPSQKDIIINIPFRSAKSLICTVCFPVWSWTLSPELKFICTSYSSDLALEHAQLSRNLMESEWFQKYFGNTVKIKKAENSKSFFVNEKGGFRKSVGVGGQITGSGATVLLLDDPNSPKKADSQVERENTNRFYDQTLYSRLNDPALGVRIIIQQRLNEDDLSGHLLKERPKDHEHICIPAEISEDLSPKKLIDHYKDGLFWHDRFNKNQLNSYKKALGSYGYAGQLQQKPAPEGGGIIKREYFEIIEPNEIFRDSVNEPMKFYSDTAYSEKSMKNNDPSAFLACFKRGGDLYIVNCHDEWLEFPDLCNYIARYATANKYSNSSAIKVEGAASGKSVVQQLRHTTSLNVIEYPKPKDDKIQRANAIAPTLEAGRVKLVRGAWINHALDQWSSFPTASHDDMVDVLIMAVEDNLTNEGFDFLFV